MGTKEDEFLNFVSLYFTDTQMQVDSFFFFLGGGRSVFSGGLILQTGELEEIGRCMFVNESAPLEITLKLSPGTHHLTSLTCPKKVKL